MDAAYQLKGKSAIVTGAGRGIGRAIARRLASSGANVAIASRTHEQLSETKMLIDRAGGHALAVVADVTRLEDVERLVAETRLAFGGVNILVNNAGVAPLAMIEQMEPQVFDRLLATNARSVFLCCRAVWPILSATGGGTIVNISSVAAYDPFPGFAAYGAAKAFVNTYTLALAAEGKDRGIRVFGVAPGAVETDMLRSAFPDFPSNQTLSPDDIAGLVEELLSPNCARTSGETITIQKQ